MIPWATLHRRADAMQEWIERHPWIVLLVLLAVVMFAIPALK